MRKNVGILISGGGSNMIELVKSMQQDHPGNPTVVVSNVPDALGLERAQDLGIATRSLNHRSFGGDRLAFEKELQDILLDFDLDMLCLAGFMRILSSSFVEQWSGRMLNIHPSLLPKFKGLNTHQRALDAGDREAGCSVHLVTPELDDGPLLGQARLTIAENETAQTLSSRVLKLEHRLYPQVLRRYLLGERQPLYISE